MEASSREREESVRREVERSRAEAEAARAAHERQLHELEQTHAADVERVRQSHRALVTELETQYKTLIEQLRASQQTHVASLSQQMNATCVSFTRFIVIVARYMIIDQLISDMTMITENISVTCFLFVFSDVTETCRHFSVS